MSSEIGLVNVTQNSFHENEFINQLYENRFKFWIIGFLLRLIASATNLEAYDYIVYRIPIAKGLSDGKGLYNDLNYNQMPIYPYLSALMYLIFRDQNDIFTAIILRFPITIADSIIPYLLFNIAIKLGRKNEGLITSIIYALNPISLIEISVATFHSIGSLFFLISIYFLLDRKYKLAGFFVSIGFFTSEYPLIALGLGSISLRHQLIDLFNFITSFVLTSAVIIFVVLLPYNANLNDMYSSLSRHPIYKGTIRGVISELYSYLNEEWGVSETLYYDIWLVLFLVLASVPLLVLATRFSEGLILDVIVIQMTLLSLFFTANHTKHIFWLLPWLLIWAINQKKIITISPLLLTIIYFLRRYSQDYFVSIVWITTVMLALLGMWILVEAYKNLITKEIYST